MICQRNSCYFGIHKFMAKRVISVLKIDVNVQFTLCNVTLGKEMIQ